MLSSFDIANYFIWAANEAGRSLSNLKLLKLVYYVQGFYLAIYGKPVFPDEIQAWDLGPVTLPLYRKYKGQYDIDLSEKINWDLYDPCLIDILNHVQLTLGKLSATQLSDKTHDELPWKSTPKNHKISEESMMNFFRDNLEGFGFEPVDVLASTRKCLQAAYNAPAVQENSSDEDDNDFSLYLQLKEEWSEVYRRLANS